MFKNYLKAARLRTLPLSLSGIIVGSFLGVLYNYNTLLNNRLAAVSELKKNTFFSFKTVFLEHSLIFLLAILTTIGFQILSNFANDYGDGVKGTDAHRIGEKRMVATGKIRPKQMKNAMMVTALITFCFALLLIYISFGKENIMYSIFFFVLGLLAIASAIKYTVGKSAYGYSGFGDVFVFLFFGLVSVLGSYFLYTKHFNALLLLPATSVGLLSVAVLNLNNMRDINEDRLAHKNTLVVKIGSQKAKKYHLFLMIATMLSALFFVLLDFRSAKQFLFLIAFIPLFKNSIVVFKNKNPSALDNELKKVALSTFLFAILFAFGNVL